MLLKIMEKIFKQIIIVQMIILPVIVFLEIFFPVPDEIYYLPYFDGALSGLSEGLNLFIAVILIAILILYYVSLFLIYFFKPSGRTIFVWLTLIGILLLLESPSVSTGLLDMMYTIDAVLSGATIVFIYFTSLKDKFTK